MSAISVLIIVDAEAALAGGPNGAVYAADTKHYLGSYHEGGQDLVTVAQDGQQITWSVAPINPEHDVRLTEVSRCSICAPEKENTLRGAVWTGMVEAPNRPVQDTYTLTFSVDGATQSTDLQPLTISPALKVL